MSEPDAASRESATVSAVEGPVTVEKRVERHATGHVFTYMLRSTTNDRISVSLADDRGVVAPEEVEFIDEFAPEAWEADAETVAFEQAVGPHETVRLMLCVVTGYRTAETARITTRPTITDVEAAPGERTSTRDAGSTADAGAAPTRTAEACRQAGLASAPGIPTRARVPERDGPETDPGAAPMAGGSAISADGGLAQPATGADHVGAPSRDASADDLERVRAELAQLRENQRALQHELDALRRRLDEHQRGGKQDIEALFTTLELLEERLDASTP